MSELQDWFARAASKWADAEGELTAIDGETGDGDLGFTVSRGARAIAAALDGYEGDARSTLRTAAETFAKSNPSSFAALFASGVIAAVASMPEVSQPPTLQETVIALRRGSAIIMERGRSGLGDRTLLDALIPSIDALASCSEDSSLDVRLQAMIEAACSGVEATKGMAPKRGRARWVGERTQGFPDAGAVAWLRLLEALAASRS